MPHPTLQQIREQHQPSYSRRRRGLGAISGRPVYGWSVKCSCGWEMKTNQEKAAVERDWKWHTREEWQKQRTGVGGSAAPSAEAPPSGTTDALAGLHLWQRQQALAKACPCCGGKAFWRMGSVRDEKPDHVSCNACGLELTGTFEPQSALEKWNRRAEACAS